MATSRARVPFLSTAVLLLSGLVGAFSQTLCFINTTNIEEFEFLDSKIDSIFHNLNYPLALDGNLCDNKLYWVQLEGKLQRGTPDGDIEDVVSNDLSEPHGIAVDSIGNNVYFSQRTDVDGNGRIEVVTCDGRYRKVLKIGISKVGLLALDITRGYLYYVDACRVFRMDTDGSNVVEIVSPLPECSHEISGLAVNVEQNQLYWLPDSDGRVVRVKNLTDGSVNWIDLPGNASPVRLASTNRTLYFTQSKEESSDGAIFSYDLFTEDLSEVYSNPYIDPTDVSVKLENSHPLDSCAHENGDCNHFCFTVPSPDVTGGTMSKCDCKTGIRIEEDGMTCSEVPENFLLIGRHVGDHKTEIHQISLSVPEPLVSVVLPAEINSKGVHSLTYDEREHYIYWDEVDPPAILRAQVNSLHPPEVFIGTDVRYVSGLALDTFSRNLYWADSVLNRIEVAYIDNNRGGFTAGRRIRKVLIGEDIDQPQGLALDLKNGYMYWADLDSDDIRIERARLDGSERTKLTEDQYMYQPSILAVNQQTGVLYWLESRNFQYSVVTYNSTFDERFDFSAVAPMGFAVSGDFLYWTDASSVFRQSRALPSSREIFFSHVDGATAIAAINTSVHFNSTCILGGVQGGNEMVCSHLCLPQNRTHSVCACPDGLVFSPGSSETCVEPDMLVFASDPPSLAIYGRNTESLFPDEYHNLASSNGGSNEGSYPIAAMALDFLGQHLYFISSEDKLIYRTAWSEDNYLFDEATPIIKCCLATPEDLAVDWLGRNLYWSDSGRGVIEVSRLDGRGRRVIAAGLDNPSFLELDPRRGDIYYVPKSSKSIHQIKMDGRSSSASVVCDICTRFGQDIGFNFVVSGLSMDFDPSQNFAEDYLVWSLAVDDALQPTNVLRQNLNTGNRSILFTDDFVQQSFDTLRGTAIFSIKSDLTMVYSFLGRPNQFPTLIMAFSFNFKDITIGHPLKQPGVHECSKTICNGYYPVCLVQDDIFSICHCPPNAVKVTENDANRVERVSCTKAQNFLLWATPTSIYYYALPNNLTDPHTTSEPQLLPIGSHGNIAAVTYDLRKESVVWMDKATSILHSVTVSGESTELGKLPLGTRPSSMSMDWAGGQVFFTEREGFQVESANVRGQGENGNLRVGSVVSAYGLGRGVIGDRLMRPAEVVYDQNDSTLYWNGGGTTIYKSSLSGLGGDPTPLTQPDTNSVQYLTLDPVKRWLYWWNHDNGHIQGQSLDSRGVFTLVTDVSNISGLSATTLTSNTNGVPTGFLFWYNLTARAFFQCDTTVALDGRDCRKKLFDFEMGENLLMFDSFQTRYTGNTLRFDCREGNSQCDYLCVEGEMNSASCQCPLFRNELSPGECSDIVCGPYQISCGDGVECYPLTYACDGIIHCTNGNDELNCTQCESPEYESCGPGTDECFHIANRCNNHSDCPATGKDEVLCCSSEEFGCYDKEEIYRCFESEMRCRADELCFNGSYYNSSCTPPTPSPTTSPTTSSNKIVLISVSSSIIVGVAMLAMVVVIVASAKYIHRQKYRLHRLNTVSKTSSSPPLRSETSSIITGMSSSMGTESTNFNNCYSPDPHFKQFGLHTEPSNHISNPPPSLITGHHSQVLEDEVQSQIHSFADPCPAPAPSVDWDNMSFYSGSASQKRVRGGAINPSIADHYPQARNPFHYTHPADLHGNNNSSHGNGYSSYGGNCTHAHAHHHHHGNNNSNSIRMHGHNASSHLMRGRGYDPVETETVFSQSTINTENGSHSILAYDDKIPPGRPPSPATITEYSEREQEMAVSPFSRITEDLGEGETSA